jgi:cytochrome c55X
MHEALFADMPFTPRRILLILLGCTVGLLSGPLMAQPVDAPNSERQTQLIRMVRQDCGSCHGIHLTGGLGPALTPDAVSSVPLDSLTATIYAGRPGTPMPGWKSMLTEAEARWIASKLQTGFPVEKR